MANPIKYTIIAKWPEYRSIDVHYYTDVLMDKIKPTWERELANYAQKWPQDPEERARDYVLRQWPAGFVMHVELPAGLNAEGIHNLILEKSPYEALMTKHECAIKPADLSMVDGLIGVEGVGIPEKALMAEAEQAEAEQALPIPVL
jgi:hypothetical protein